MRGMMRKGGVVNRTVLGAVALLAGVVIMIAGCNKKMEKLTGNIQLAGSTPMGETCAAIGETFTEGGPGIAVSAEYAGSTAGMEALLEGTVDIDTSPRDPTQEELEKGVAENIVARDGIAVIPSKEVTGIGNLTSDELRDIFCGRTVNWNELGGPNMSAVVTGHEAGSGTRDPFEEILGIVDQCRHANELNGSGAVLIKTAATQGVAGYISMAPLDDTAQAVSTEGVRPTRGNMQNGSYSLNKTMVMATMEAMEKQNPLARRHFEFVYSDQGQPLIDGANLMPIPGEQRGSGRPVAC